MALADEESFFPRVKSVRCLHFLKKIFYIILIASWSIQPPPVESSLHFCSACLPVYSLFRNSILRYALNPFIYWNLWLHHIQTRSWRTIFRRHSLYSSTLSSKREIILQISTSIKFSINSQTSKICKRQIPQTFGFWTYYQSFFNIT